MEAFNGKSIPDFRFSSIWQGAMELDRPGDEWREICKGSVGESIPDETAAIG